ncbi:WLM domain-containing protein [Suillus subaureus]|uniref:WLM domain-containing protein n=1 Tax=Suillus subaureus TaxID=48587 RepID=A0A9P7JBL9_9AGAM|nr:WLM domain-containing protein [Suillus subaureus]KAG1812876.1 WLM domain-containing protein [Suillus subaureus]
MSHEDIVLAVTFRGTLHTVFLPSDAPLSALHSRLELLTSVPPSLQKLIYRGKKIQHRQDDSDPELTIAQAGLRDGLKVQMLGSTVEELGQLTAANSAHQRKEQILRERALKPQVKLRSTGSSSTSSHQYRFHRIEPLTHLPRPETATECLTTLSKDPAVLYVMQKHHFSVGLLTELAPHEHPGLLGRNVGSGVIIKLRIRLDTYDGFRPYLEVRRVLCHELAHNVWGEHNNDFKELNSQLNREVAEFEAAAGAGTYQLSDLQDTYQPSSDEEVEALTHVLGGTGIRSNDTTEDRRKRALEAATARLRNEEELERSCGTSGPQKQSE